VFDWPMYQPVPDCHAVNFKELHVRRRAVGWAATTDGAALSFIRNVVVTTAAGKVVVNWIQLL